MLWLHCTCIYTISTEMGLLCDLFRINYNILNLVLVNFRLYHHYEQTSREVTFTCQWVTSQPRFHYKVVEASLSGEKKSITLKGPPPKKGGGGHFFY